MPSRPGRTHSQESRHCSVADWEEAPQRERSDRNSGSPETTGPADPSCPRHDRRVFPTTNGRSVRDLRRASPKVQATHGDKARTLWKSYPIDAVHQRVVKIAEAAHYAEEHGNCWESTMWCSRANRPGPKRRSRSTRQLSACRELTSQHDSTRATIRIASAPCSKPEASWVSCRPQRCSPMTAW
jgi:hypothetical protein